MHMYIQFLKRKTKAARMKPALQLQHQSRVSLFRRIACVQLLSKTKSPTRVTAWLCPPSPPSNTTKVGQGLRILRISHSCTCVFFTLNSYFQKNELFSFTFFANKLSWPRAFLPFARREATFANQEGRSLSPHLSSEAQ